ncbi:substrate-binding periplasmic protein [Oleidesulfovibrio sp.]|uniref:substrate-binding periplasmic protein n=1 Tax=Oleidesulfovibrio sp. TaxID=2909707 RepID=UPI003A884530
MPPAAKAEQKTLLKFATLHWPPYCAQNIEQQGYASQVVRQALHIAGYQVNLYFLPWERAVRTMQQPDFAGYTPEYKEDRLTDCIFSDPFPGGPLYLFKRKEDVISYNSLHDLKEEHIGVVSGYINTPEFDNADYLQKHPAVNDETNLRKLLAGRLDLLVGDKLVIMYLMQHVLKKSPELIEPLGPPLAQKSLHVCFKRQHPDANQYVEAFNSGLLQLQKNGTLKNMHQQLYNNFNTKN